MLIYNILISAILTVLFFIFIWNLYILRKKNPPHISDTDLPFVSVLVPARNEELNINSVLVSLLVQDYPNYEVIVLNDNSEDKTGEIIDSIKITYPKLKVINGKPLESGWTGKSFACNQLFIAAEPKSEWILFTDADTKHDKDSIRRSVTLALHRNADLLTLIPTMTMISFAEKLIMPMLMFTVCLLLPMYFIDKRGFYKYSIGIGPFMLFKKSAYKSIGGHESVKDALVEDVWLGKKIKEHNLKLVLEDGKDMLSVRMYRNFSGIWEGFSKNIFAGFEFSNLRLFAVNLMYVLLFFMPFVFLIIELFLHSGSEKVKYLLFYQVFLLFLTRIILSARFSLGFISSLLHPLGAISVPLIAVNSWRWIVSGKGAKWKGRVYNPKSDFKSNTKK